MNQTVERVFANVERAFEASETAIRYVFVAITICALLGITVLINTNIFVRYVLKGSIPFAEGTSTLLNAWVTFVGGAVAYYVGDHVRIRFAERRLGSSSRRAITVFYNLLIFTFALAILWYGGQWAIQQAGSRTVYLGLSRFWLRVPIALGGFYLMFESVRRVTGTLLESFRAGERRPIVSAIATVGFCVFIVADSVPLPFGSAAEILVIFAILIGLILIGMPIAFAMGSSVLIFLLFFENVLEILVPLLVIQEMGQGIEGFSILAIPMFIYAGRIMSAAGITTRIVDFANLLVGRMRAGLSHVNVVSSMLFAGISGSAVADTAAIGSILIPAMEDDGYDIGYTCSITCSSAIIGPIIPPSIIMIIYAITVNDVGISELFLAGVVPGLLFGGALIGMTYFIGYRTNWEKFPETVDTERPSRSEAYAITRDASLALLMPLIILGGILSGVFTATEAGAVATGYALLIGIFVYRSISIREFIEASYQTTTISGVTLLIIAAAMPITQIMAIKNIPSQVSAALLGLSQDPLLIVLLIVGILSVFALFIEEIANIILWAPVFSPLVVSVNVDPLHFGVVMIMTLAIGMITPPLGVVLFVAAPLGDTNIERISKNIAYFFIAELLILLLIIFVPSIATGLPRFLGY